MSPTRTSYAVLEKQRDRLRDYARMVSEVDHGPLRREAHRALADCERIDMTYSPVPLEELGEPHRAHGTVAEGEVI